MAIASGIAVPAVYVLEDETGLNAFAAGYGPNEAVVTVTRGLLLSMNRDQMQGVIGHEMSHILNGDMRLNIRLLAWLHGLLVVYLLGRFALEGAGRSRDKEALPLVFIGLALIALGWLGVLLGRVIQAAVSRQREFLADASSVQFTRNPDGIGMALRKIAGASDHSVIRNPNGEKLSYMCLGAASKGLMSGLWATHPPIEERIRKIYGRSMPVEIPKEEPAPNTVPEVSRDQSAKRPPIPFNVEGLAQTAAILNTVGTVSTASVQHAESFMQRIPTELRGALNDPDQARLLAFAAMVNLDGSRAEQDEALARIGNAQEREALQRYRTLIAQLGQEHRIDVVELAVPALRRLDAAQRINLLTTLKTLALANKVIVPAELLLFTMLRHRLEARPRVDAAKQITLSQVALSLGPTLSLLANHSLPSSRSSAFAAGAAQLKSDVGVLNYVPPERLSITELSAGFSLLRNLKPLAKEIFLSACVTTVLHDGKIDSQEIEVIRTFCAVLDVPFPPVLDRSPS
jgi:uncharacterized tellurite resistance protein B-like protein